MVSSGRRCTLINCYPEGFLEHFYSEDPSRAALPYTAQHTLLLSHSAPIITDTLSSLRAAGWECEFIAADSTPLLKQWCIERDQLFTTESRTITTMVEVSRSDVVLLLDAALVTASLVQSLRPHTKLLAAQLDSSIPNNLDLSTVDLIISASPSIAYGLRQKHLPAHYLTSGFVESTPLPEDTPLNLTSPQLIGSTLPAESYQAELEQLLRETNAEPALSAQPRGSLTIIHRDYEQTDTACHELFASCGSHNLVLTNHAPFLSYLYELGHELISYRSIDECIALCQFFQSEPEAALNIARAGRVRTLKDHRFDERCQELIDLFESYLNQTPVKETGPLTAMAGIAEQAPLPPIEELTSVQSASVLTELESDLENLDEWIKALVEEPAQMRPAYLQWHERLPGGLTKSYLNHIISRPPEAVLSTRRRLNQALQLINPKLTSVLSWLMSHTETVLPSYHLEETNRVQLVDLIHAITNADHALIESYFKTLESDTELRDFTYDTSQTENGEIESEPRYARHLLWYTLIRILKPQNPIIIGRGDYLVLCTLKLALKHNLAEGSYGRLTMVGPGCSPGFLGDQFIKRHSQLVTEDLSEGLGSLEQIDFALFCADATSDDEYNIYKFLWPKLSQEALVATENISQSTALSQVSREMNKRTHSWSEKPSGHFVDGKTVGLTILSDSPEEAQA